jgi:hypothetical protein
MIVPRPREVFVQELLIAELLARRGEGPLARKRWPRPRPRSYDRGAAEAAPPELESPVVRDRAQPGPTDDR